MKVARYFSDWFGAEPQNTAAEYLAGCRRTEKCTCSRGESLDINFKMQYRPCKALPHLQGANDPAPDASVHECGCWSISTSLRSKPRHALSPVIPDAVSSARWCRSSLSCCPAQKHVIWSSPDLQSRNCALQASQPVMQCELVVACPCIRWLVSR